MRLAAVVAVILGLAVLTEGRSAPKNPPQYPPSPHVAATDPKTPREEQKCFHLPPGFAIELVAAEPDIHKPINLAFDAKGRLWLTESVEYPFPARGRKGRDAVKILSDFGPDGRARKITTFADGLNIPIGVLPLRHGALVYSIPDIYRMTDTNGDGKADERRALYGVYGHRDTHGMTGEFTQAFDGWVYACHGFSNTSTVKAADGSRITMNSGNTYRFRTDGSHVEYVTHGQVNPFGLSWDPLGNLYSCDCHSQPIYQLLKGAYYPSFGKPDDGLGFAPEMFTNYQDSTAIAGIAYYAADHFPAAYRGAAFIGDVVTNRIDEFDITWHGSSPRASLRYLLKSDDRWFRPVSIALGPDGALYVADFYNRIIGHYEVPLDHPGRDRERGRVWRIVYRGPDGKGKPRPPRADWTKATATELVKDLAHPNLTVRLLATNELADRSDRESVAAVRKGMGPGSSPYQRMHGLWVLDRRGALDDAALTAAAKDKDRGVRVHAMRVLTERRELPCRLHRLALAGLKDADPFVQRAAAQALGSHPDAAHVRPLLDLRRQVPAFDTHLLHVVRMALRDQLVPASTWKELHPDRWDEKDARAVADVCPGVPTAEAAAFLLHDLRHHPEIGERLVGYVRHVARYGTEPTARGLLAFVKDSRPTDLPHQVALLRAVSQGTQERGAHLSPAARTWAEGLTRKLLASSQGNDFVTGIELAGALHMKGLRDVLLATAVKRGAPHDRRTAALNALVAVDPSSSVPVLGKVLADSGTPAPVREHAAGLLGKINQGPARAELVQALPAAPARLQNVIALELARSRPGAEKLLEAVTAGKASPRILLEKLVELRLAETKLPRLKERVAKLTAGLPTPDSRIQEVIQARRRGFARARPDVANGAKVFTRSCAICHQIAHQGAKIGPNLDGIGNRGVDRLLEDVLDPNRNVDQAFRLTTLTLQNGQIVSGLLLKEEGQVLVVADSKGKEVRVPRNQVEERAVSQISPMPADLAEQIPEKDFYDLLAYLLSQKPADEKRPGRAAKGG